MLTVLTQRRCPVLRAIVGNLHVVLLLLGGETPLCLSAGLSLISREEGARQRSS